MGPLSIFGGFLCLYDSDSEDWRVGTEIRTRVSCGKASAFVHALPGELYQRPILILFNLLYN